MGMALNLETDNVGVVIFGSTVTSKKGDTVKRTNSIVDVPIATACWVVLLTVWVTPSTAKAPSSPQSVALRTSKAPGIIPRKSVHEPMATWSEIR